MRASPTLVNWMEIFVYRLLLSVVHQFVYSRQRNSYGLHTEHKKEISTTWFLWQPASMSLMTTVMKDSQEDNRCVCAYCTRNSSCVSQQHSGWAAGAYILLRMWTRANICVERLLTEEAAEILLHSWFMATSLCYMYFSKMDYACQAVFRLSLCIQLAE